MKPMHAALPELTSLHFKRPRPFAQTDAALLYGQLDPSGLRSGEEDGSAQLAVELQEASSEGLKSLLVLEQPDESSGSTDSRQSQKLQSALQALESSIEYRYTTGEGPAPHALAPHSTAMAIEPWLMGL